jgi:uncharacterized protein
VELLESRLAAFLGCPRDQVGPARQEAARDWAAWTRRLFDDVALDGMVMDPAWSGVDSLTPHSLTPYAELAGRPVWELQRLEPTVDAAIGDGAGVRDVLDTVDTLMSAAASRGAVGFKTVLAYRTGLDVDPTATVESAQRSLSATDVPVRHRGKALRDLLLRHVLGRCTDLGLPIQIHTGFGDSEIRPASADPLLLDPLLRTVEGRSARIVLLHGSWPWHDAVGYLAAVHRNVWAELSLVQLFAPATTAERMLRLLEVAPTNRVLFGSDGHGSPESVWFGCLLLHEAWDTVRTLLRGKGAGDDWLDRVHDGVFGANARSVYGLDASVAAATADRRGTDE